ncbi:MAG: EAL domain-containing protein [Actinomycetota bacterium]
MSGLGRDPEDSAIVTAIVSLAHALGLPAVAEGVGTEEQLKELRRLECDLAQGYYFAHPQPAEAPRKMFGLGSALAPSEGDYLEDRPSRATPRAGRRG